MLASAVLVCLDVCPCLQHDSVSKTGIFSLVSDLPGAPAEAPPAEAAVPVADAVPDYSGFGAEFGGASEDAVDSGGDAVLGGECFCSHLIIFPGLRVVFLVISKGVLYGQKCKIL